MGSGRIIAMFDNWDDADRDAWERNGFNEWLGDAPEDQELRDTVGECVVIGVHPAKAIKTAHLGFLGI